MKLFPLIPLFAAMTFVLGASMAGCKSDNKKLEDLQKENEALRQLADIDRKEMENQYEQFALQYDELKRSIRDDSLLARLNEEQARAESLLEELKKTKADNYAEITRLKKELATVRAVLQTYIRQVDSLMQVNAQLRGERDSAIAQTHADQRRITTISSELATKTEQVAIASQLNATNVQVFPLKKNDKEAKRSKDVTRFAISFAISRNVTAATGNRTIYVRLMKNNSTVVGNKGTFQYENRSIEYSAAKTVEYTGQETDQIVYVAAENDLIEKGTYVAYIFVDGQMIGSGSVVLEK